MTWNIFNIISCGMSITLSHSCMNGEREREREKMIINFQFSLMSFIYNGVHSLDYKLKFYAISDSLSLTLHFGLYDYQCIDLNKISCLTITTLNKMCILWSNFMSILWFSNISIRRSQAIFNWMRRRRWWEILCHFQKLIKASCWWPFEHSHTLYYYYYDINKHQALPPLYIVSPIPPSPTTIITLYINSINIEKLIKLAFNALRTNKVRERVSSAFDLSSKSNRFA